MREDATLDGKESRSLNCYRTTVGNWYAGEMYNVAVDPRGLGSSAVSTERPEKVVVIQYCVCVSTSLLVGDRIFNPCSPIVRNVSPQEPISSGLTNYSSTLATLLSSWSHLSPCIWILHLRVAGFVDRYPGCAGAVAWSH